MKKCLFTLFLIVIACISLYAQTAVKENHLPYFRPITGGEIEKAQLAVDSKVTNTLQTTYKTIGQLHYYMSIDRMVYGTINPIAYDPVAKALVFVQNLVATTGTGQNEAPVSPYTTYYNLGVSFNNGNTWTYKSVDTTVNSLVVMPSIGIINTAGETNAAKYLSNLTYRIAGSNAIYNSSDQKYYYKGNMNFVHSADGSGELNNVGPNNNYRWWIDQIAVSGNMDKPYIAMAGLIIPLNNSVNAGNYGISVFDPVAMEINERIPKEWAVENFRIYTEDNTRYYSGPVYIDSDPDGVMYAVFDNFVAPDETTRQVLVTKSTDMGVNWTPSPYDQMPNSAITDYLSQNNARPDSAYLILPYDQAGLVVTGKDEFSYITQLEFYTTDSDTAKLVKHLIEINKSGSTWKINGIAELSFVPNIVISNVSTDQNTFKDSLEENPFSYQIQVAKTADGHSIVVKWVDAVKRVDFTSTTLLNADPNTETYDHWYTNDIFLASRNIIGEGSNDWTVKNVTNDDNYELMTFIPRIVPDLDHIPVLNYTPVKITNTQYPRYPYPDFLKQILVDIPPTINFKSFSVVTGIEDNNNEVRPFTLNEVRPNPASGIAEISFVLDAPANAKIEIFNALGQKMMILQDGSLSSGFHALNVNTEELNSGVYYYTLTVGGKSLTKTMTVVH